MPDLGISSWSLRHHLGAMYPGLDPTADRPANTSFGAGTHSLLELPALVAEMGIPNLEVCHFHFPRTDSAFLARFRESLAVANVRLFTLLIDAGDITASDPGDRGRDIAAIERWIDIAAEAGAARVRVIAGQANIDRSGEAVRRSVEGLAHLAGYAAERGVRVVTENWLGLSLDRPTLIRIVEALEGSVGICADFGNWSGPGKYDDLAAILPYASSCHAKAEFPAPGQPDRADFIRCLDLARAADFSGTYVLIFESTGEERGSLRQIKEMVTPYLS
jgi:sugar phosphate isomerase/epimerase